MEIIQNKVINGKMVYLTKLKIYKARKRCKYCKYECYGLSYDLYIWLTEEDYEWEGMWFGFKKEELDKYGIDINDVIKHPTRYRFVKSCCEGRCQQWLEKAKEKTKKR